MTQVLGLERIDGILSVQHSRNQCTSAHEMIFVMLQVAFAGCSGSGGVSSPNLCIYTGCRYPGYCCTESVPLPFFCVWISPTQASTAWSNRSVVDYLRERKDEDGVLINITLCTNFPTLVMDSRSDLGGELIGTQTRLAGRVNLSHGIDHIDHMSNRDTHAAWPIFQRHGVVLLQPLHLHDQFSSNRVWS